MDTHLGPATLLPRLACGVACAMLAAAVLLPATSSAAASGGAHRATVTASQSTGHRAAHSASHRRHGHGATADRKRARHGRDGARRVRHNHRSSPAQRKPAPGSASGSVSPVSPVSSAPAALLPTLAPALEAPAPAEPPAGESSPSEEPALPANTEAPSVEGATVEGETLSAAAGTWSGDPTSYEYQWQACDTAGEACSSVSGATSPTYALAESDVGTTMRAVVTASNPAGSAQASSQVTRVVMPPAPTIISLPTISGEAVEGETLRAGTGMWWHYPTSYTYRWQDCNALGERCLNVPGAASLSYKLTASDVGHTVRVVVVASNIGGANQASSVSTAVVEAAAPAVQPPVNTVLPVIGGVTVEGETLSAGTGSWSNTPTSYTYQWQDCNSSSEACTNTGMGTSSTRKLMAMDVGHTIRVVVTATNAGGSAKATSAQTATVETVAPAPKTPVNTVLPSVGGTAEEGKTLSASTGSWSNSPTSYAYQWEDCNSSGAGCSAISGATGSTRVLASSDVGHTLRVVVKATSAGGSGEATSAATATVVAEPPPAPVNTVLPAVSGTAEEGQTLSASTGTWSNSPTSYAYQWEDCNSSGASCSAIGGATASTRVSASSDVGHTLRVVVKAVNAGGSDEATSAATAAVVAAPPPAPVNIVLPTISGTAEEGQTLSASAGSWSNSPTSYGYQWEDCNTAGESCSSVSGATSSSYKLVSTDVGHEVRVVVTATNAGGSGKATSAATATVTDPPTAQTNCFENPETEGTARIEKCGYPGQKNVGVETCSALAKSSSSKTITTNNQTIENTNITGQVVINASNVTLNNDCVVASGEAAIKVVSGGTTFTVSDSTIRGENATTGRIEFALASEYPEGGAATKDRIEGCEECIHGWKWTVKESFVFANGELKNPAIHREDWFNNRGWVIADDDTMLNPETQTAIVFSEDSGIPCENEMTIENSLFAGSGYMFQNCAHASGSGPGKFVFKGNRIARCTGKLVHGEGNYCEGSDRESPESGFDANGYFPDGGYYGIYGTCEACTSAGLTWEDNYWDNNLETLAKPG